ncbi:hypothetical protein [Streptomyces rectiverticillatus]
MRATRGRLASDLLTADPRDIPAIPAVFTNVGGDVVHDELTV